MIVLSERIKRWYEGKGEEMANTLARLISVPALSPDYGGDGELEKAEVLTGILEEMGLPGPRRYDAPDGRAKGGVRPNLVVELPGSDPALAVLTHLDVVPPGDLSAWETNPFKPVIREGRLFGRGSEDNGQGLVASLFAAKAAAELGADRRIILYFVSDEERGSGYGLRFLLREHPEIFPGDAHYLVPDAGNRRGDLVEVAEKGVLWFRVRVRGRQVHASVPHKGVNALRILARVLNSVDRELHSRFPDRDELFRPPTSTFEPTVSSSSSDAPNVVPGEAEAIFDCRLLPGLGGEEVLEAAREAARGLLPEGASLEVEEVNYIPAAPKTPPDSPVVVSLLRALRELRGIEGRVAGIGGSTFASFLRAEGMHAVVWSTIDEMAHQPNEYCVIENLVADSMVMAHMAMQS